MSLISASENAPSKTPQGPSQADWERRKATISRLYLREGKTLAEVMAIMAQMHRFHASARMFKFRFKRWRLDKSLQSDEVLAMSRVKARRQARGVGCDFWKHGRRVSAMNLERYLRDHPHVAAQLKKHVPEDVLMGGHIEALLPPHIVVLTPSLSLIVDKDLHSLENLIIILRNYINGYTEDDWDSLPGFFHTAHDDSEYVVLSLILTTATHVSPAITHSDLQRHFDLLHDYLKQDKLNFLDIILAYTCAIYNQLPEFAQMLLCHTRDMSCTIKGPLHPVSVLFSEVFHWSNSLDEVNGMATLLDMIYDNVSGLLGEDNPVKLGVSGSMDIIRTYLGSTTENRHYGTSHQLRGWIKNLETTDNNEMAITWIAFLLPVVELGDDVKLGLDILEHHRWREIFSFDSDVIMNIGLSYWRLGEVQKFFDLALEALGIIAHNYGGRKRNLAQDLYDVGYLEWLLNTLDVVPEEEFEGTENLKKRAEDLFYSLKLKIGTAHMASLQLENFEDGVSTTWS